MKVTREIIGPDSTTDVSYTLVLTRAEYRAIERAISHYSDTVKCQSSILVVLTRLDYELDAAKQERKEAANMAYVRKSRTVHSKY